MTLANKISWVMEMVDKVSGPAKSAGANLGEFIQVTHSALAAVQLIGQAAIGAGQMIASGLEPAISREKSLGAFETLLGTAEQARNMYGQAVKFAAETPFETAQVVDAFQKLLTAKFSEEEVPIALRIIGDAASMQEDSQAAVSSVTRALSQIRSKGRLQGEELMQIQEAVPLNTAALYEKLGAIYGTNAEQARKMQEAGQIDAQAASFAILEQMSQQFGGNMERASKQVGGLVSTLQSRPAEFLAKLQDTRGYDALRDVLGRMAGAFDPETSGLTPFITQLGSGVLERAAVSMEYLTAGAIAFAEGLQIGLGPLAESFGPANVSNMDKFRITMEGLGQSVGKLADAMNSVIAPAKFVFDLFYRFGEWQAQGYGEWIMKPLEWLMTSNNAGLLRGQKLNASAVAQMQAQEQMGGNPYGGLVPLSEADTQAALDASGYGMSPEDMADAYGLPQMASGGIVRRPTVALIGEAGPEAVVPLRGRSGGRSAGAAPITISAPISMTFAGPASASDANVIASTVGPAVEAHLYSLLERLALQSGRYA